MNFNASSNPGCGGRYRAAGLARRALTYPADLSFLTGRRHLLSGAKEAPEFLKMVLVIVHQFFHGHRQDLINGNF